MSTNNSNNSGSGNANGGTITIGAGGGGGGGNAGAWQTITIPYQTTWITGSIFAVPPVKSEKKKDDRDGCDCKKCKEFYPYAEPNQDDGTLICYACRHGY